MFFFIVRRLLLAIPMVFLATIVVFMLVANAGDPLEELRQRPNSEQAIINRTQALNLDKPAVRQAITNPESCYWLRPSAQLPEQPATDEAADPNCVPPASTGMEVGAAAANPCFRIPETSIEE